MLTLLYDRNSSFGRAELEPSDGQRAAEDDPWRPLGDIVKPAGTVQLLAEPADIKVSLAVDLTHAEKRDVEISAVVKVELERRIHHGVGVEGWHEGTAECRSHHAAEHSVLIREDDTITNSFFVRHERQFCRHASTEINHIADVQLLSRATQDDAFRSGADADQPG